MDDEEPRNATVYALFPGIDTTPFGAAVVDRPQPRSDDGWETAPETTIDYDDERVNDSYPDDTNAPHVPSIMRELRWESVRERTREIPGRRALSGFGMALLAGGLIATLTSSGSAPGPRASVLNAQHAPALRYQPTTAPTKAPARREVGTRHVQHRQMRRRRSTASKGSSVTTSVAQASYTPPVSAPSAPRYAPPAAPSTPAVIYRAPSPSPSPAPIRSAPARSAGSGSGTPAWGLHGALGPGHSPDG